MLKNFWIPVFIYCLSFTAGAQPVTSSSTYSTELDKSLIIKKITLLPVTDNVEGIYARPLEKQLTDLLKDNHKWDFAEAQVTGQVLTPTDLETDAAKVKKLGQDIGADALVAARATRGPNGLSLQLDLFLTSDGLLISQEVVQNVEKTQTAEALSHIKAMYQKVMQRLPYSGMVMSRNQNRVTINLGERDGLKPNSVITAVLLVTAQRHPKFQFLINTEKEVLGKIKIEKVDETLSFGTILTEKERGVIQKDTKLLGIDQIQYDETPGFTEKQTDGLDPSNEQNRLSFGNGAQEWLPVAPPTFGKVGFLLGLGTYSYNTNLETAGSKKASTSLFPSLKIDSELWLTTNWTISFSIYQGVISVDNPVSGSDPDELSIGLSRYSFYVGHSFLLQDDFFGPKVQVYLGYSTFKSDVDTSSPLALTSASYSGLVLGVKGELPISEKKDWGLGASLDLFLSSNLSETPKTSGSSSSNSINSFSIFGTRRISERLRGIGSLNFELFKSRFSGNGTRADDATESSHKIVSVMGGIEYMF